ncbi:MAG: TetR family transcriptional regulator [Micromonosporaceae bacterium]|nr:TetR family transcriptional regulator [Micromonosporaceae bacterium]
MAASVNDKRGREGAPSGASPRRGEQTRALIVDTAVRLFAEHGYDQTTMRRVASDAGVSLGNAYYYFGSKEHLVEAFYDRLQAEIRAAAVPAIAGERDFATRLRTALHAAVDVMTPYHGFAGKLIKTATDPASPVSPFSEQSAPAREASIGLFREVVADSTTRLDARLRDELPELLWLGHMGITLYWVHDTSPGQRRTRLLIDRATPLVGRLVELTRLRVLRNVTHEVLELVRALRA